MKAIQYRTYGGYQENRVVDLERTRLKEGEVLIEMRTVGINPFDNTFRSGHIYFATPENLPRVGGQTGVGVVVESENTAFKVGDRVLVSSPGLGLAADGTWREFVSAPASALSRVPAGIDDDHAAAFLAGAGYLSLINVSLDRIAHQLLQHVDGYRIHLDRLSLKIHGVCIPVALGGPSRKVEVRDLLTCDRDAFKGHVSVWRISAY